MSVVLSIPELMRYICDDNTSELNSPGHCHNPKMSRGTKNNVLVTKPSERFQDTRVILKKNLVKFGERRVKTSTSGVLTRATKGLRSKKNPTLRYITRLKAVFH